MQPSTDTLEPPVPTVIYFVKIVLLLLWSVFYCVCAPEILILFGIGELALEIAGSELHIINLIQSVLLLMGWQTSARKPGTFASPASVPVQLAPSAPVPSPTDTATDAKKAAPQKSPVQAEKRKAEEKQKTKDSKKAKKKEPASKKRKKDGSDDEFDFDDALEAFSLSFSAYKEYKIMSLSLTSCRKTSWKVKVKWTRWTTI